MMMQVFGSDEDRRDFYESELIPHFNYVSHEQGMDRYFDDFRLNLPGIGMLVDLDAPVGDGRNVLLKLDEFGACVDYKEYWAYESMLEDYMELVS